MEIMRVLRERLQAFDVIAFKPNYAVSLFILLAAAEREATAKKRTKLEAKNVFL